MNGNVDQIKDLKTLIKNSITGNTENKIFDCFYTFNKSVQKTNFYKT